MCRFDVIARSYELPYRPLTPLGEADRNSRYTNCAVMSRSRRP